MQYIVEPGEKENSSKTDLLTLHLFVCVFLYVCIMQYFQQNYFWSDVERFLVKLAAMYGGVKTYVLTLSLMG